MRFIGCKTLLLDHIKEVIDEKAPEAKTFCDIFSGTATVARYFKQWYEVTSNDLLYFSYVLQKATIENDEIPKFKILKEKLDIEFPIQYLNQLGLEKMKEYRQYKHMTQEQLADMAEVNEKYYGRIERNESCTTITVLEKLCKALNIGIMDILVP